jgi:hypothetical protein
LTSTKIRMITDQIVKTIFAFLVMPPFQFLPS